jgi:predicted transposase YdaD
MELKYNDIYLKGKEEENKRWIIKIISYGLKQNLSLDEIASIADISVEEVEQYINENCLN